MIKYLRWFILTAGAVLVFTGAAKLLSSAGGAKVLDLADPVFMFSNRHVLMFAGVVEAGVGLYCLVKRREALQSLLVAALATCFVAYRLGLALMGYKGHCNCLGQLTDALGVDPALVDRLLVVALAYLLVGGYAALFLLTSRRHILKHMAGDVRQPKTER